MDHTSSVAKEQIAEVVPPSAASTAIPSDSSAAAANAIDIRVFSNAQNVCVSGGTFNISQFSTTHHQAFHSPSDQPQCNPPARTFLSTVPNSNVLTGTDSETYARLLLPKRQGFPLWLPEPYEGPTTAHLAEGVMVGDVGVVNDGGFRYLFNVCHSSDSPLNSDGVPDGFKPFPLKSLDVERQHLRFPPDSYVASSQTERVENIPLFNSAARSTSTFTSAMSEGAIIVLPTGAVRFDARNLAGLRQYAIRNASEWYKYVNGRKGWEMPNDALYLVTGCDKCNCWAAVTFCQPIVDGNNTSLELLSVTHDGADANVSAKVQGSSVGYKWKGRSIVASRAGPAGYGSSISARKQNHCVFFRGYKIAINAGGAENDVLLSSVVDSSPDTIFSKGTHIPFGLDAGGFPGLDEGSISGSEMNTETSGRASSPSHISVSMQYIHERRQRHKKPYHSSDVVNRFLLSKKAGVVTHDDECSSLLEPEASAMPEDEDLIGSVLTDKVVVESNCAFLLPLNSADPIDALPLRDTLSLSDLHPASLLRSNDQTTTNGVSSTSQVIKIPSQKLKIVFPPGEQIHMDLRSAPIHSGKLFWNVVEVACMVLRQSEYHVFLFNDCQVVLTRAQVTNSTTEYHEVHRLPLELLTLSDTSPHAPYHFTLIRSGRPGYRHHFFVETAQEQIEWTKKTGQAIAKCKSIKAKSPLRIFALRSLQSQMPIRVSCSVPFIAGNGEEFIAFGSDDGVWIGGVRTDGDSSKTLQHILNLKSVIQCAVLDDFGIFVVLADKTIFAYDIEFLVPLPPTFCPVEGPVRLNRNRDANFFRVGKVGSRTLVVYMRQKGSDSVCRVMEVNKAQGGKPQFRLFRSKSEWFRIYRDFSLPNVESFDLVFLNMKLAIMCTRGFEILDLNDFKSVTFPRLREEHQHAELAKRCRSCRPLGMFSTDDEKFLLCYDRFGMYVDKQGIPLAEDVVEWESIADRVALHMPYILLINADFIEIRQLETGRLEQILLGNCVRCISDGHGVSTNRMHEVANQACVHVTMGVNAESGVIIEQIGLLPNTV